MGVPSEPWDLESVSKACIGGRGIVTAHSTMMGCSTMMVTVTGAVTIAVIVATMQG